MSMTAAQAYDALEALRKSKISENYRKRALERIDFDSDVSIDDQVKALEAEYVEITTGQAPGKDQNSESSLDPEMKEFLQEKFPQEENQNSESE